MPVSKITLHQKVTDHIIEAMKNAKAFEMPWHQALGFPVNALTDKAYQGINTVSLWVSSMNQGYESSLWATYKQWQIHDRFRKRVRAINQRVERQLQQALS